MTSARLLRFAGFLLFAGAALFDLTACSAPGSATKAIARAPHRAAVCRVGPNGGPPAGSAASRLSAGDADRGIGGTGAASDVQSAILLADRGIGGTGIVGVVTGFGSICVNGLEVAYDASATVDIDGAAARPSQLRVGEVVAIQAAGPPTAPKARSIAVRIEAAGRIDSIRPATGEMQVAGQRVVVPARVPGAGRFSVGDGVAVSGLRQPDGTIVASRIAPGPVNTLAARGPVRLDEGAPHLGALALPPGSAKPGAWVHVAGVYADGQPHADKVRPDRFCPNLYHCLPGSADHLVLEAFIRPAGAKLWVDGMLLPVRRGVRHPRVNGFGIVSLERQANGTYTAVNVHALNPGLFRPHIVPTKPNTQDQPLGDEPIVDRAIGGGHHDPDAAIASLVMPGGPAALDFDRTSMAEVTAKANPPSVVAPASLAAPAIAPLPGEPSQDPLISDPSSYARRGVPMSSATPGHGKMTLISGSATQVTTATPGTAGSGGRQKGPEPESIGIRVGPSSGDTAGVSHAGTARLP